MVNALLRDALSGAGAIVDPVDVAGPRLAHNRGAGYHARRFARNLAGLLKARSKAVKGACLYIVPDAGLGAWYTLGHVVALASRFDRIVVHHHSCRYIEEHSRPIEAIVRRTRGKATHIFLTNGMAEAFQRRYGPVAHRVATNARFVAEETRLPPASHQGRPLVIGHLSNLCADKGFFEVAETFEAIRRARTDAQLVLAGPILEPAVDERLAALRERHGARIIYLGALSGEAKRDFYRGVDLFLFPTRFRQEAAPLVIYEALSAGVPVLATDRGVIVETIPAEGGAVCARDADFSRFALEEIGKRDWTPAAVHERSVRIKAAMSRAAINSVAEYDALVTLLVDDQVRDVQVYST